MWWAAAPLRDAPPAAGDALERHRSRGWLLLRQWDDEQPALDAALTAEFPEWQARLWDDALGHQGAAPCTATPGVMLTAFRDGQGFGSAVVGYVSNAVFATVTRTRLRFAAFHYGMRMQLWFQQHLSIFAIGDAACRAPIWTPRCPTDAVRDASGRVLRAVQTAAPRAFALMRQHLVRELLRMDAVVAADIHARMEAVAPGFCVGDAGPKRVAIHVRRGDKRKEVPRVDTPSYVAALRLALGEARNAVVYVMSDDRNALHDVERAWKSAEQSANVRFIGSSTQARPDGILADAQTHTVMVRTLADVALGSCSDAFVGTQSSNLGMIICEARGNQGCFNAEHAPGVSESLGTWSWVYRAASSVEDAARDAATTREWAPQAATRVTIRNTTVDFYEARAYAQEDASPWFAWNAGWNKIY